MLSSDFNFNSISLDGLTLNIYKYLDEDQTNLDIFIDKINNENKAELNNINFNYLIKKIESLNSTINYKDFNNNKKLAVISDLNFHLIDFELKNNNISVEINNLSLKNNLSEDLKSFSSIVTYSEKNLLLKESKIEFGNSKLRADLKFDFSNIDYLNYDKLFDSVYFDFSFKDSKIITADFNSFYKKINDSYNEEWVLNGSIIGNLNNLILNEIIFTNENNYIKFNSSFKNLFNKNADYDLALSFDKINTSSQTVNLIFPQIFGTILPSSLKNIGRFNLQGLAKINSNEVESNFNLKINQGSIQSSLKISQLSKIDNAVYKGSIKARNLDLSRFVNIEGISTSNFEFDIKGRGFTTEYLNSSIIGKVSNVIYKDEIYDQIEIFGKVKDQVFDGSLISNDKDLNLVFNGLVDFSNDLIDFDFNTSIKSADLYNLGFDQNAILSGLVTVKLRGSNMKNLIGDLTIENAKYSTNEETIVFDNFYAQLRNNEKNRIINVSSSDIFTGILIGEYDFYNLKSSIFNNFGKHYSNFNLIKPYDSQNISFSLNLKPKFLKLLSKSLLIDENTFVKGKFESNGSFQLNLESSLIEYNDIILENIQLNINNEFGYIKINDLKSKLVNGKDFKLESSFVNDTLFISSTYNSLNQDSNNLKFFHTINKENKSIIGFTELDLIINNQDWSLNKKNNFSKPRLVFDRSLKDLELTNVNFINDNQFIDIDIIENTNSSNYSFSFKNVSLENLTSIKNKIFFNGNINGDLILKKELGIYKGNSRLTFENLKANNYDLGSAVLNIEASKDLKSFNLNFDVIKESSKIIELSGNFGVEEEFFPLDMKLTTTNFDISPFSKIGKNVISNFDGLFNSDILISGSSENPIFSGFINTDNVSFKIPYLNVQYNLKNNPSFVLKDQSFIINKFSLFNPESLSEGIISGEISHDKFKDWILNLKINSDNLMILNTKASPDLLYFGTAMFNGEAEIQGPSNNLSINLNGSTNKNTKLSIPIKKSQNTGDLNYLNFVSSKDIQNSDELIKKNGLKVDLEIEFNSNANLEVILDSESNSRIEGIGNGNLNFKINTLGNFNIFGDFVVEQGSYFYKSLGIVNREFIINKGSTLIWNGDPYLADININANYEVPGGANPAILIQNTSFNRKIPTNVNVFLSGNLIEINTPSFEINFPNTSGPIKSEIEYYLVDNEKKQKQAISLLYQGTFIDEVSLSSVSSQAITNNLFQKASGIIDDIFTNSDDKMNIGINYLKGDKNAASSLLNRDRLGLTLKTEISDRILINGKVGVPVGGVEENIIIGDVEIEFLLNEEGNLKARFFNKENEYQYFANDIGYTQGMGISYELDFDSFKEIFTKNSKLKSSKAK